jgi:hypothetical protein
MADILNRIEIPFPPFEKAGSELTDEPGAGKGCSSAILDEQPGRQVPA